jgi:hypothetical protein
MYLFIIYKILGTQGFHSFRPAKELEYIEIRRYSSSNNIYIYKLMKIFETPEILRRAITNYSPGEYVIVKIFEKNKLGVITEYENLMYTVKYLKQLRIRNNFGYPQRENIDIVLHENIITKIEAPTTTTGRIWKISENDFDNYFN